MARFRLSRPAQIDVAGIFAQSAELWGTEAGRRYAVMLATAMREVASNPAGRLTHGRDELLPGLRSLHLRHVRVEDPGSRVRHAVHILYYRAIGPQLIEIVRVLHEKMEPARRIYEASKEDLDEPPSVPARSASRLA
jgi:toxin ParE1/3/4